MFIKAGLKYINIDLYLNFEIGDKTVVGVRADGAPSLRIMGPDAEEFAENFLKMMEPPVIWDTSVVLQPSDVGSQIKNVEAGQPTEYVGKADPSMIVTFPASTEGADSGPIGRTKAKATAKK